jgi:hypothetical protein
MAGAARHIAAPTWLTFSSARNGLAVNGSRRLADAVHALPELAAVTLFWAGALAIGFLPTLIGFALALALSHNVFGSLAVAALVLAANVCWLKFGGR